MNELGSRCLILPQKFPIVIQKYAYNLMDIGELSGFIEKLP